MKKKILTFLLAICLILPCAFMLTACGGDGDKNFNVNINTFKNSIQTELQDGVKEIRLVDATGIENYTIGTHIGDDLGLEVKKFEVEKGKKLVLLVTLERGYEINDVTIKADGYNGEDIEPEEAYTESPQDSWIYSFVVTESLSKELWITFDGAPAKRTQTITLSESNVEFFDQAKPEFPEDLPAKTILADAKFSLYYEDDEFPVGRDVFENIGLNEFKAKVYEGFSFEVKSGAILKFVVTPNYTHTDGDPRVLDLAGGCRFGNNYLYEYQTFKKDSTTVSITTFEDVNINFDWSDIKLSNMWYGVETTLRYNHEQQEFVVKTLEGTQIAEGSAPFVLLEDYFDNINEGLKLEIAIDSTTYANLLTSSLTFDLGMNYISFADALSQGIVSVDDESSPTTLTITIQNSSNEIKGNLQIYVNFEFQNN
ncbi:MAG: hypothetical protein IJW59_04210 [Clostridia bacterium]|nr:hypothetical protein [Clostridia bacterium]